MQLLLKLTMEGLKLMLEGRTHLFFATECVLLLRLPSALALCGRPQAARGVCAAPVRL